MAATERDALLRRIRRADRWTALRLRVDETLARAFLLLPIPLLYAVGTLTWIKVARPSPERQELVLLLGLVPLGVFVLGTLLAWFRRRPPHSGALALDRHHGLHDQLTSALSFRDLPDRDRTPMMDAAIEDAVRAARELRPRKAAPLHLPRELPIVGGLLIALFGIALLEVQTVKLLPPEKRIEPMVLTPDDIELFREMAQELEEKNKDPEVLAAVRKFNQLIEDIAQRRLDRVEVFKRMEELERDLLKGAEADREALDEGLKHLAKELEKSDLSKPVASAMEQKNLEDAEKAMRELADKLKNKRDPPSKQQLDKLRDALKQASKSNAERAKRLDEQRKKLEQERKRLLKKQQDKQLSQNDKRLLQKKDRQLERLNREKDRNDRARRQLSRLDRELAKAAEDLLREMGMSAEDLENAAEDLNRMAKEEMTEQEKEELRRRLQELRELMRQQGKGGKERMQRLLKFGQRARGGKPGKSGQGGQDGQDGKGQGMKPGGKGGDMLVMGPSGAGGKSIPIPGSGSGQGEGQGQGQGQGQGSGDQPGGQGAGQGGESYGSGHDENLKGDKSDLKGQTKDVTAAGVDTGEGTASSEVIYGAAQRGFVGRGYKQVYTDYKTVAERVMNEDEIPPGYRFYVQRYFQLIRPRE